MPDAQDILLNEAATLKKAGNYDGAAAKIREGGQIEYDHDMEFYGSLELKKEGERERYHKKALDWRKKWERDMADALTVRTSLEKLYNNSQSTGIQGGKRKTRRRKNKNKKSLKRR